VTQNKVKTAKNVEIFYSNAPVEIKGKDKLESLVIEDVNTKARKELKVDGVFIEIGHVLDTEWVKEFVERNELNEIKVNRSMETKTPGLFAAGDVTDGPFKQTINAASEGAVAALTAYNYLMKKQGRAAIKADWS
jgi:thioredoxin reductase (NADPH)